MALGRVIGGRRFAAPSRTRRAIRHRSPAENRFDFSWADRSAEDQDLVDKTLPELFPLAAASELQVPDSRFADSPGPDVDIARIDESSIDVQPVIIAVLLPFRRRDVSTSIASDPGRTPPTNRDFIAEPASVTICPRYDLATIEP
jgi:hypothetical protein